MNRGLLADWRNLLALAAWLALLAALGLGLLVPLYVDELATKMVQARYLAEAGQMVSLFPQCAASFVRDTPLSWQPAALLYALLYADLSPLGLRVSGIVLALAWLALLVRWAGSPLAGPSGRLQSSAAVAAVATLGVLPLTLVLARPEQWTLLLLTAFLVFPGLGAGPQPGPRGAAVGAGLLALFLLATSLLSYAHPKAVFFLPLVLASAWATFGSRSRWLLLVAVAFAGWSAYQGLAFARDSTRCSDAPILASIFQSQTVPLPLLVEAPGQFVAQAVDNVVAAPARIAQHARIQAEYQSGWLPPMPRLANDPAVAWLDRFLGLAITLIYGIAVVLTPLALVRLRRLGCATQDLLLPAALWVGLVGHVALYKEWNFYSGVLALAIAAMLAGTCMASVRNVPGLAGIARGLWTVLLGLALLSAAVLAWRAGPPLLEVARRPVLELQNQPYSVKAFGYDASRARIRALAAECGVDGDRSRRLVVDDLSYFAFTGLRQPLHAAFLWPGGWGADIAGRTRRFLLDMDSPGIVAQCTFLSPEFFEDAVRDGNLCCVSLAGGG